MFSFAIGVNPSEEIQPSAESAELPNDVRLKLQEILPLLDQDVGQLVKDAEPIRAILKSLEGRLPESIEDALVPAAFIESHRRQVLKAQKRLADRTQQEQVAKQRDELKNQVGSICHEIDSLTHNLADLQKSKSDLEAKREHLLQELQQVNQDIDNADNELSQIQPSIEKLEIRKREQARQAYQLRRSIQLIPGSADDDKAAIREADEIRLRAINVIRDSLGLL
jgi:chromosome segregation ATPase